ncbi:MAG: hydrogenase expression/formation protein HypE [Elusimicrobia bacterium]|nr:hydrogenase expression/formation protein HypE [Elusimicrobiota bacterium]
MEGPVCPVPKTDHPRVQLSHGGGGRLTQRLVEEVFLPAFSNPMLEARHDGAVFEVGGARLAFTTDAHVVSPLFFPGGDIGSLAVYGTVNDLAMCGARPLYLSAAFILEEGLPIADLKRVAASMSGAARRAGVQLVTGDTKVVGRGKGDGLFISTSGIGVIEHRLTVAPSSIRPGDAVILSGDVGRHGMAVMAVREGLSFESSIESDAAPLNGVVEALLGAGIGVRVLRDLTRGGLATCLVELAEARGVRIDFDEELVPVREDVEGACEMLGFDPLYVANEGRLVAVVPHEQAEAAVAAMRARPESSDARVIGRVGPEGRPSVVLRSSIGASRLVDMLSGEQLPRIC